MPPSIEEEEAKKAAALAQSAQPKPQAAPPPNAAPAPAPPSAPAVAPAPAGPPPQAQPQSTATTPQLVPDLGPPQRSVASPSSTQQSTAATITKPDSQNTGAPSIAPKPPSVPAAQAPVSSATPQQPSSSWSGGRTSPQVEAYIAQFRNPELMTPAAKARAQTQVPYAPAANTAQATTGPRIPFAPGSPPPNQPAPLAASTAGSGPGSGTPVAANTQGTNGLPPSATSPTSGTLPLSTATGQPPGPVRSVAPPGADAAPPGQPAPATASAPPSQPPQPDLRPEGQKQLSTTLGTAFAPPAPQASPVASGQGTAMPSSPTQVGPPQSRNMLATLASSGRSQKEAVDLASATLGITHPEGTTLTPDATGASYAITRAGKSPDTVNEPYATYDAQKNRVVAKGDGKGGLTEEARQYLQNVSTNKSPDLLPIYYPGGQEPYSAPEVQGLDQAGEQALASTPGDSPERAAALAQAGVSPEAIQQQLKAGRLSVQQAAAMNLKFNGITEVNATIHGTQQGLGAWAFDETNPRGEWFRNGSPEQKAVAINEYFDGLTAKAEGNLLADPERLESLRREALGAIDPRWKEPGSTSPGRAPKDGPAGFESIPMKDGGHTLLPSGKWTVEDLDKIHENPEFAKVTQAERDVVMNDVLSKSFTDYASRPGFDKAAYQRFNQIAQQARDKSASLKTWGETGSNALDFTGNLVAGIVRPIIATATDSAAVDPDGEWRVPFGNVGQQVSYWGQKAWDIEKGFKPKNLPARFNLSSDLDSLHDDLVNANFPLDDRAKLDEWMAQRSQALTQSQKAWYEAVNGKPDLGTDEGLTQHIYTHTNSLLNPANAELVAKFMQTRDPAVWKELCEKIKQTPDFAKIEDAQKKSLAESKMVKFMTDNYGGGDYKEHMIAAGDPIEIASNLIPVIRGLRAGKVAAEVGIQAGKATVKGTVAGFAKSAAIDLGTGGVQTLIDNPDASFADFAQMGKENIATALGLHGAGYLYGKGKGLISGAGKPGNPGAGQPPPLPVGPQSGSSGASPPPPASGAPPPPSASGAAAPGQQPAAPGQPPAQPAPPGQPVAPGPRIPGTTTPIDGQPSGNSDQPPSTTVGNGNQPSTPPPGQPPSTTVNDGQPPSAPSPGQPPSTIVNDGQPPSTPPPGQPPSNTVNDGQPPSTPPPGQPSSTTVNNGQPPSTPPPGQPPSTTVDNGQPPSSPPPDQPPSTSPPARPLPSEADNRQALDGIKRLQNKGEQRSLSLDEQRELDRHEKTIATSRQHHLETKQKVLSGLTPPRELDPHETQVLADARKTLARPVPGTAPPPRRHDIAGHQPSPHAPEARPLAPRHSLPGNPDQPSHGEPGTYNDIAPTADNHPDSSADAEPVPVASNGDHLAEEGGAPDVGSDNATLVPAVGEVLQPDAASPKDGPEASANNGKRPATLNVRANGKPTPVPPRNGAPGRGGKPGIPGGKGGVPQGPRIPGSNINGPRAGGPSTPRSDANGSNPSSDKLPQSNGQQRLPRARKPKKAPRSQPPKPPEPPVLLPRHKDARKLEKSPGPNGGGMQSHHALQQEWAKQFLGKNGYNPDLAPTIMVETGTGLPHTIITNRQGARRDQRRAGQKPLWKKGDPPPDPAWTHGVDQELGDMVSDLEAAGFNSDTINQVLQQQYRMLDKLGVTYQPINYQKP